MKKVEEKRKSKEGEDEGPSEEDKHSHNTEELPQQNKSIIWAILKQLKVGAEVKHLQLPAFCLQPRSLLEKLADGFSHPEFLFKVATAATPEERFLSFVQFYMSGWHVRPKGVRNPLNPIIGEIFRCKWELEDGTTSYYVAEQLSHHPPRSAFCYFNIEHGIAMNTFVAPNYVKFMGNSAETKIMGLTRCHIFTPHGEEVYEATYPGFLVRGILFGTLTLEQVGKVHLSCKTTGYSAEVEFKSKGVFGKLNTIQGKIFGKDTKHPLYTLSGIWDTAMMIAPDKKKEGKEFFDAAKHHVHRFTCPPLAEHEPNESRRLWEKIAEGIIAGDEEMALAPKRELEKIQRAAEEERRVKKIEWIPKMFKKEEENLWVYFNYGAILSKIREYKAAHPNDIQPIREPVMQKLFQQW